MVLIFFYFTKASKTVRLMLLTKQDWEFLIIYKAQEPSPGARPAEFAQTQAVQGHLLSVKAGPPNPVGLVWDSQTDTHNKGTIQIYSHSG